MSALFTTVALGSRTAPNRIAVSPMCQYSAFGGMPTDWHLQNTMTHAISGAGLVMMEATAVEERGQITHGCLGIYSESHQSAIAKVIAAARRLRPKMFCLVSNSLMQVERVRRTAPGKVASHWGPRSNHGSPWRPRR